LKILRQKANKAFHKAYKTRESKDWELHKEARRAFKKYSDAASVNHGIVSVLILKQYMSQLDYTSYSAKTVQPK